MPTRFRALILLTLLVWQSLAVLGSVTVAQRAQELAHMVVHSQELHHHHADLSLQLHEAIDEEDGLAQHLHADSGASPTGLVTSLQSKLAPVRFTSPAEKRPTVWRSPTLEGPLRPPKLFA